MSDWHYVENGAQRGPVPEDQLRTMISSGRLKPTDLVWKDGLAQWQEARAFPGLVPSLMPGAPAPATGFAPPVSGPPGPPAQPPASGKAVGSLVCSILGFFVCALIGHIVGLILGYSAKKEIRNSGGALGGEGMATAGIILGWIGLVFTILVLVVWLVAVIGTMRSGSF